jgi:predicted NBD/HSP70 family sugar kinase
MVTLGKQKILKQINRGHILNILRSSGELSVSEISDFVNLSKPTIMKIMKYYLDKGYLIISGKGSSTEEGGKKPNIFKFNAGGGYAIGMIITANKLKSVLTNLKGAVVSSTNTDLDSNEGLESVLDKILSSYNALVSDSGIAPVKIIGLAIGIYGITDYHKGTVLYSPHFPSWGKNIQFSQKVKKKIPNTSVMLDNISRFQVFAEKTLGVAISEHDIVSVLAGKGLSAGVILEDELKRGPHSLMGEVGHMVINPSEPMVCACGAKGCFEVMVSIARLKKLIDDKKGSYPGSALFNGSGKDMQSLSADDIFTAYKAGDGLASDAMEDIENWFAIGLSNIILIYDPQMIVLQGVFVRAGETFLSHLKKKVGNVSLLSVKKETKIRFSELGDMAGLLGAATFVINMFFK